MTTTNRRIYGFDFSGAKNAGTRIWVAGGVIEGDTLHIDMCRRADALPESGKRRQPCLRALRSLISNESDAAFGFDFPFGLPASLVDYADWESFALAFPGDYEDAQTFRHTCREASGGRELKRMTDRESQTPFSPHNLRLYRQTCYGIRDLPHPLVRDQSACVLPMQEPLLDKPWLLEVLSDLDVEAGVAVSTVQGRRAAKARDAEAYP